jgi:two-component system, NtrC family, response regulator AtoC
MEKILIIDDDDGLNHFLGRFFKRKGYAVTACASGQAALATLTEESFDLILLDYKMPGLNGLDVLKNIKTAQVKTPVILMTAYSNTDTAIEAMKRGAYDYLVKPFERNELSRIVSEALLLNRQMKEIVRLPGAGESIAGKAPQGGLQMIGQGRKMQEVYKTIGQVAEKDVSVLIGGESGTGKELVARALYHHSRRKDRPFIAINCAAIPENLFESELFGYERGAFTGAERTCIGKIERCDKGTCFLDEIGDMSMALQAKLLRVLQEGEFERLGGRQTIKVDVRIIAATNKDLELEVRKGRFREDLYWRLKIISIHLPPLRKRTEDIPELVAYFITRFGTEYAKPVRHVSENILNRFAAHAWPGNVRELENCIRRAVLLCSGDIIGEDHITLADPQAPSASQNLPEQLIAGLKEKLQTVVPDILRLSDQGVHANLIEMVEETLIAKALDLCANNQVKAARMLGISRNTLRHRIKKMNEKQSGT